MRASIIGVALAVAVMGGMIEFSPPPRLAAIEATLTPYAYLPYISRTLVVQVLPNHSHYMNSSGHLVILGEVYNETDQHVHFVKASVNLYDASGNLLDTGYSYLYPWNLPAGERNCFWIQLDYTSGWARYEFEPPAYSTTGAPFPKIALVNVSASSPSPGIYRIIGLVRNDNGTRVNGVYISATLYDTSGKVFGCGRTIPNNDDLDAGQSSAFEIAWNITGRDYAQVASYRIIVDGTPDVQSVTQGEAWQPR